jgi:hypothetical protein
MTSAVSANRRSGVHGRVSPERWPGDVLAVGCLIALPAIAFGIPALVGHPVLPGDDLTQNFPLRVLAGRQIRDGQLPLYNPYIWSGAPLLAGWNAAAAYPLTWLFAVLPGAAAWTLNMIITWTVAGLGMFGFLRALRLASFSSVVGAMSFAFAGAMSAQVGHFGLVAGMAWVPVQLLGVLRLSEARSTASRLGWTGILAGATGLTILAGEPRAVADAGVIVFIYAAWRITRLGRRSGRAAICVTAGLALGICLGAVQWMPGVAAVGTSQRAASSVALFNSGSLSPRWLLLMLVPDLLGGSGSFGQPGFFATYNLAEVTGYVGILPLVAAAVLLGRLRLRERIPEWIVWHFVTLTGVLLALGGHTPVGHLLAHLPFFGDQRLQSRNILIADLALSVLVAYWADDPQGEGSPQLLRARGSRRLDRETVLGVVPPLAVITVVVVSLWWGAGLLHWLRGTSGADSIDGQLRPWLVPYALIAAGAIALVIAGRHLHPKLRARWLGVFIFVDLVVFTLLTVVAALPHLGHAPTAAPSPRTTAAKVVLAGQDEDLAAPQSSAPQSAAPQKSAPQRSARQRSAPRPIAALGYPGRFAIYDPDLLDAHELPLLGPPDLNVISATPSVQGYTSLVDSYYAAATGSHQATGEGQDVLAPSAIGNGVLDQLDTSILLTVPAYLMTAAAGSGPPARPPEAGHRDITAGHQATWYFATTLDVSKLEVPDADARHDAAAGTRIGIITPDGLTRWFPVSTATASLLVAMPPHPVTSVAVVVDASREPIQLGPPSVIDSGGSILVADGQLQNALRRPRWGYAGHDGPFAIFVNRFARGPLTLQPLPGRSLQGASILRVTGAAASPMMVGVRSPHGVRVIRSVAAIGGWTAIWHPRHAPATTLPVRRVGLVQGVDVPAGQGVITWSYQPPWFTPGLALSLGAAALILLLVTNGRLPRFRSLTEHRDGSGGAGLNSAHASHR